MNEFLLQKGRRVLSTKISEPLFIEVKRLADEKQITISNITKIALIEMIELEKSKYNEEA
jgi:hypothetical protein